MDRGGARLVLSHDRVDGDGDGVECGTVPVVVGLKSIGEAGSGSAARASKEGMTAGRERGGADG